MDVKYINPFIQAFTTVIPQLGFQTVKKGNLSVKGNELQGSGVNIIVGVVGAIKGNVVYAVNLEDAKKIASSMMMGMPVNEFDEMAQSALAELTNMLTANAATYFAESGISIDISTPTLFHGKDISLKMSSNQVLCIQLLADDIPIEVNIAFEN